MGFLKVVLFLLSISIAKTPLWKVMGASLILPGAGEFILDKNYQASYFFSAELVFISGFGISYLQKERRYNDAFAFAQRNAELGDVAKSEELLLAMEDFRRRGAADNTTANPEYNDSYDLAQIRQDKKKDHALSGSLDYYWDWGDPENASSNSNWNSYKTQIDSYRDWRVRQQIFIGALLLNRVISVINVVRIYKSSSPLPFQAQYFPKENTIAAVYTQTF